MTLNRSDISHLVRLARLHVSDEQAERLSNELTQIIGFIDSAAEDDLSGRTPMIRPSKTDGTLRDDIPSAQGVGASVRQAPETEDGYVKVPPVRGLRSSGDLDRDDSESPGGSTG